ncbi:MAG: hypothetical protein ACI9OJ_000926 [Myxococcota bacterium]|jgi:hypothetical protein
MERSFGSFAMILSVLGLVLLTGCSTVDWRKQNLALSGEIMVFQGNKFGTGKGGGSGFWVRPNIVATNAHVAVRARGMIGLDDEGNKYRFREIIGLDRIGDIAFLRAERDTEHPGVTLIDRPSNPLDLRGRRIKLLSNTALVGTTTGSMFLYGGEITNVITGSGNDQVLHNAPTAGGASGSGIFDDKSDEVISINWGSSSRYNSKLSTAAWRIKKQLKLAEGRLGTNMKELFTIKNAIKHFKPYLNRQICLKPKQKIIAPVNATMVADMGLAMTMTEPSVLVGGLAAGNTFIWKGLVKNKVPVLFSMSGKGMYKFVLANPTQKKVCGRVLLGNIAWEDGIK